MLSEHFEYFPKGTTEKKAEKNESSQRKKEDLNEKVRYNLVVQRIKVRFFFSVTICTGAECYVITSNQP